LRDLLAAFDCLAAQDGIDPDRLGVVGSSYGGYLGALLVAERQPRWLALQAPALYKDADFDRPKHQLNRDDDLPAYRRRRLARAANLALRSAATFDGDSWWKPSGTKSSPTRSSQTIARHWPARVRSCVS
jgi:acetyl esterase/lipase